MISELKDFIDKDKDEMKTEDDRPTTKEDEKQESDNETA